MISQDLYRKWKLEKAIESNRIKYHTDTIQEYNGKIIAESGNWTYKVTIFKDMSACIEYIAKPGTGCESGIYCGTDIFKMHFSDHCKDWIILDPGFFTALSIAI